MPIRDDYHLSAVVSLLCIMDFSLHSTFRVLVLVMVDQQDMVKSQDKAQWRVLLITSMRGPSPPLFFRDHNLFALLLESC